MPGQLTDENLKELEKVLQDSESAESKLMRSIAENFKEDFINDDKSYAGIEPNKDNNAFPFAVTNRNIEEVQVMAEVDPSTGKEGISMPINLEKVSSIDEFDESSVKLDEENSKEALKAYGLTDDDSLKLFNIILRVQKGEKFNIYGEMPDNIKQMVRAMVGGKLSEVNAAAKSLVMHFIRDLFADQSLSDLQQSIAKELGVTSMPIMYSNALREMMEKDLLEKADKYENIDPNKAAKLRTFSSIFTETYHFNRILEALEDPKIAKSVRKDLTRYKRITNDFNSKYYFHKLMIKDIRLLASVLPNAFEISVDEVKRFSIAFCKTCANMTPDKLEEHYFMYYTISNLLLLQNTGIKDDFGKEIYTNFMKVIEKIRQIVKVGR